MRKAKVGSAIFTEEYKENLNLIAAAKERLLIRDYLAGGR